MIFSHSDNPTHLNHACNATRQTPLLYAAANKQWKAVAWLLKQPDVWIDVQDLNEKSFLLYASQTYFQAPPEIFAQALQQRTLFPEKSIQNALGFLADQKQAVFDNQEAPISQKTYHQFLLQAVAPLVGCSISTLKKTLEKNKQTYLAVANSRILEQYENGQEMKYERGMDKDAFLRIRILLFFDILVEMEQQGARYHKLPEDPRTGETYLLSEAKNKLFGELQGQLTTLWTEIARLTLIRKDRSFYEAWANGVLHTLTSLPPPPASQTLTLFSGHLQHTFYLTITRANNTYSLRIDNQSMATIPQNSLPPMRRSPSHSQREVQPFLVTYFPIEDLDKKRPALVEYLVHSAQNQDEPSEIVMPLLYKKIPAIGPRPPHIARWPYHLEQTDAQNCIIRNHNVGMRIRLGKVFYDYLRKEESIRPLLVSQERLY